MMVFNEKGLLNPGFSEYKLDEFEKIFVNSFNESQSRKAIFNGFIKWMKQLLTFCYPDEIWVDGSFVTNKVNPNDMDIVVFVDLIVLYNNKRELEEMRKFGEENLCDTYIAFSPNEHYPGNIKLVNHRNYWKGQFGFDREDNPKGIVKLSNEDLESFIKEVVENVK